MAPRQLTSIDQFSCPARRLPPAQDARQSPTMYNKPLVPCELDDDVVLCRLESSVQLVSTVGPRFRVETSTCKDPQRDCHATPLAASKTFNQTHLETRHGSHQG